MKKSWILTLSLASISGASAIAVAAIKVSPALLGRPHEHLSLERTNQLTPSSSAPTVSVSSVGAGRDANITIHAGQMPQSKGRAEISDVFIDRSISQKNGLLVDFRITNQGDLPVSISRVRFAVCAFKSDVTANGLQNTGYYEVKVPSLTATGTSVEVRVAREIKPGETDRFSVSLDAVDALHCAGLQPTLITSSGEVQGWPVRVGAHSDSHESLRSGHEGWALDFDTQ